MFMAGLSLSGVLWLNGTTVVNEQGAYNNGLIRIQDYVNAHTLNAAQGTTNPDQHSMGHILVPTLVAGDIAVASTNSPADLGVMVRQLMTRIHTIEGTGTDWATGGAIINTSTVNTTLVNILSGSTIIGKALLANGLSAPVAFTTAISDYKVVPSSPATALVLHVNAGPPYIDTAGGYIPAAAGIDITLPAQPTTTNNRYVYFTKQPATGSIRQTASAVDAVSPIRPTFPIGDEPLACIFQRGATGQPGGIVQAADIEDLRFGSSTVTATGGGGSSTPASPEVVIGASGTALALDTLLNGGQLANATPYNSVRLDRMRVAEKIIGDTYTSATLDDFLAVAISGDIEAAITATGGQISIVVGSGKAPITIRSGGVRKQWRSGDGTLLTSTISSPGPYVLAAYMGGATDRFGTAGVAGSGMDIFASGSVPVGWVPLRAFNFDGSTIGDALPHGPIDYTKPVLNGLSIAEMYQDLTYAATNTIATTATITNLSGTLSFQLPPGNWIAKCRGYGNLQTTGAVATSTNDMRLYVVQSSGVGVAPVSAAVGLWQKTNLSPTNPAEPMHCRGVYKNLGGGYQNFSLAYYYAFSGTAPAAMNITIAILEVTISRMAMI
jgi:hypothetical protein